MVVKPMIRNNICMNAHPQGCALHVREQIDYVRKQPRFRGPRNALIIGGSAGYGLATRIAAAFGAGAGTLSVAFEKPASEKRGATVGWYTSEAFKGGGEGRPEGGEHLRRRLLLRNQGRGHSPDQRTLRTGGSGGLQPGLGDAS